MAKAGTFKLGHDPRRAKGGARINSGRKPDEFKRWLSGLVHNPKSRERLKKILQDAEDADEKITDQGVCVPTRAKADTYIRALELAWSYDQGKPSQSIDVSGENPGAVVVVLPTNNHGTVGTAE